uniref:Uncharacterized protein n=1 Tax=Timema monikensis TaxID=170555 RepID=A0A7R9E437_9NEOP|nr:unnamed protein product [Timema monikensis]
MELVISRDGGGIPLVRTSLTVSFALGENLTLRPSYILYNALVREIRTGLKVTGLVLIVPGPSRQYRTCDHDDTAKRQTGPTEVTRYNFEYSNLWGVEGKNKQYTLTGYVNYGEEDEMFSGGMDGRVTVHLEGSLKSTWAGGSAGQVLDCSFGLDVLDPRGHLTPIPA